MKRKSNKTAVDAVAYAENFNGGGCFYQWHMVVICIWSSLFVLNFVTIWRHIHVSKLTLWRSLLTWPVLFVLNFVDWNLFYYCVLTAQTWH